MIKKGRSAFTAVLCCLFVLIATTIFTQRIAAHYSYDSLLGSSIFGTLYSPDKALSWTLSLYESNLPLVLASWLLGFGVAGTVVLTLSLLHSSDKTQLKRSYGHGSASWATRQAIEQAGLVGTDTNDTSLILSGIRNEDTGKVDYLVHTGPESALGFAPSRSGKGVGLVIPNLLNYAESVFVLDVKGELWEQTAGYRSEVLKQHTLFHNPASLDKGNARFNVLDEIRITEPSAVKDAQLIAEYLVPSTENSGEGKPSGGNDHFVTSARSLLVGIILFELNKANVINVAVEKARDAYENDGISLERLTDDFPTVQFVVHNEEREVYESDDISLKRSKEDITATQRDGDENDSETRKPIVSFPANLVVTVTSVIGAITNPETDFREYLQDMQRYKSRLCCHVEVIQQIAVEMSKREDREFSSVLSSLSNPLSIYRDPILAAATSSSDFSLMDIIQQKKAVSLYLIIPPSEVERLRNYFGMIINILCRRLTEKMPSKSSGTHKLLLMLDEFSKLPALPVIQDSLDHFAGYGIKAFIIVQDIQTLTRLYGRYETLQSNCKVRIAFTPNKFETAELLSKMIGTETVVEHTHNRTKKPTAIIDSSVGENQGLHARALVTPDEIMQMSVAVLDVNERMVEPGDALVFVTGCRPIKAVQTPFFMDTEMLERSRYIAPRKSSQLQKSERVGLPRTEDGAHRKDHKYNNEASEVTANA